MVSGSPTDKIGELCSLLVSCDDDYDDDGDDEDENTTSVDTYPHTQGWFMLLDEIEALARNPKLLRQNLQNARPPVKEILHFIFSSHTLDLPTDALDERNFGDIAFAQNPRGDALAIESSALARVFVPSQNQDLDRPRRIKILREILRICTVRERQFLLNAIRTRTIPGIPREAVVDAYGEDWLKPRPPKAEQ